MAIVQTSPRVFGLAGGLLIAFNGIMAAVATGNLPTAELPTPDSAALSFALHNGVFISLLVAGHLWLKKRGVSTRSAYAMMGGAAAVLAYAFALHQGLLFIPPVEGTRLTAGIIPGMIGMIAGTLYVHFAGYEPADHPVPKSIEKALQSENAGTPIDLLVFDGPVQVRTSMAATALAATVPTILIALVVSLYFGMVSVMETAGKPTRLGWSIESTGIIVSGYLFVVALIVTVIPGSIGVQIAHGIARAMKRTDYLAYAAAGAGVGLVSAIVLMIVMPVVPSMLMLVSGPIMAVVYRRVAGIEPLALPEVILATDRRTLVDANDPARRTHAVVMNR